MPHPSAHRYHILEVLGHGGFGTVYRARMDGGEGFIKDVAIKLLNDENPPDEVLRRFRDESRILGLVRDRAVIRVDPPIRLNDRWAVVMEYADGVSTRTLLRQAPLPPRVALEIVQEVARALDSIYAQAGPDGEPLRLLHRDIKPSNLQITPSGEVKLLDFGIARAQFERREAETTQHVAGTFGYMAPERFAGHEAPSGDIYSLGVVLRTMVTRENPRKDRPDPPPQYEPDVEAVLGLTTEMMARHPKDRPTAEEVEERARVLAGGLDGPSLRVFARTEVPAGAKLTPDDLVGDVLSSSTHRESERTRLSTQSIVTGGFAALLSTIGILTAMAVVVLVVGVAYTQGFPDPWATSNQAISPPTTATEPSDARSAVASAAPATVSGQGAKQNPEEASLDAAIDATPSKPGNADCPDPVALESKATRGALESAEYQCVRRMAHDPANSQTQRAKYGRLLLVDGQVRCATTGACDEYEREQNYFFAEIDRSDPEMLYAWTVYLFKNRQDEPGRNTEVVTWGNRALERKSAWVGADRVARVDALYEMLARAQYTRHQAEPDHHKIRIQARNAALDWLSYRAQIGKDHSDALSLCASAAGSTDECTQRMFDPNLQSVVTFVSVPIGASVRVDGAIVGEAPVVAELPHGNHTVEMVSGDAIGTTEITVGPDRETRWLWRTQDDSWAGSF